MPANAKFNNKLTLITGAGSGIGRATALKLGELSAKLIICDVNRAVVPVSPEAWALYAGKRFAPHALDAAQRSSLFRKLKGLVQK